MCNVFLSFLELFHQLLQLHCFCLLPNDFYALYTETATVSFDTSASVAGNVVQQPYSFPGPAGPKKQKIHNKIHDHFFFHEMASHRSSQAENWTYRRHFTMCVFFCFGKSRTKQTKPSICKVTSFKLQHPTSTSSIAILAQAIFGSRDAASGWRAMSTYYARLAWAVNHKRRATAASQQT